MTYEKTDGSRPGSEPGEDGQAIPIATDTTATDHAPAPESPPSGEPADAWDPRGYSRDVLQLIDRLKVDGDRESALITFICEQEEKSRRATDVMHWERGAAANLLFTEVLLGKTVKDQDDYLRDHFKAAYRTIRKDLQCFLRYRSDPKEFFRYTFSIAVVLVPVKSRADRESICDKVLKGGGKLTVQAVARQKAMHLGKQPKTGNRPVRRLSDFNTSTAFDTTSYLHDTGNELVLRINHDDLKDDDLNDVARILNRHGKTKIRLLMPEAPAGNSDGVQAGQAAPAEVEAGAAIPASADESGGAPA